MSQPALSPLVFLAFLILQVTFLALVIRAWLQLRSTPFRHQSARQWFALVSLICGSVTLIFTASMTIYARLWQRQSYDGLESRYLLYTPILSLAGIICAIAGKRNPRAIGLLASAFTLIVAILDAMGI